MSLLTATDVLAAPALNKRCQSTLPRLSSTFSFLLFISSISRCLDAAPLFVRLLDLKTPNPTAATTEVARMVAMMATAVLNSFTRVQLQV